MRNKKSGIQAYWDALTKAERKAEMKRRVKKRTETLGKKEKSKRTLKRKAPHHVKEDNPQVPTFGHAEYLLGKVERDIEHYATSEGISTAALAEEVGSLLFYKASGKVLGPKHRVPRLPKDSTT